jgi:hypothetical protein
MAAEGRYEILGKVVVFSVITATGSRDPYEQGSGSRDQPYGANVF